jgi:hypothetical protein
MVEFELRGILVHAWETTTAAQLLNPFAWIRHIHPDTVELADLEVLWCTAWALDRGSIPASREL